MTVDLDDEDDARGDLRERIIPILLDDTICKAKTRLRYIKHWQSKMNELNQALKDVDAQHLKGIREDIDLYSKIRNAIAGIMDVLRDMKALTPEQLDGSGFDELFEALKQRLPT